MGKKKGKLPIKTIGIVGGVGVTIVVFALLGLPLIQAISNVAPQGSPDEFMIPFVDEEVAEEVGNTIGEIIMEGSAIGECGFEQIDPVTGQIPSCVGVDDGTNAGACSRTDIGSPEQCEEGISPEMIEEMIKEVVKEFEKEVEKGTDINMTVTSKDPPIKQIIDDITTATAVNLSLDVVKIDANNNRFDTTFTTEIPAFAFFIEEETNIDFTNGFIEFSIDVETFANTNIDGSGKIDLLIANQTILAEPVDIQVLGTTDSDGNIDASFISQTGATSDRFLFSFEDNMDKFPTQGVTKLELKLVEFQVQADSTNDFALSNAVIFTMSIATNPNEIIISDEQGELVRIFPTDDRFVIRSASVTHTGYMCQITSNSGAGCTAKYCRTWIDPPRDSSICTSFVNILTAGKSPLPSITGINLFENGVFLKSVSGGSSGIVFDEMLTRNTNYTITIADPQITFDFTTPKSQKNYDFKCWSKVSVNYAVQYVSLGWGLGFTSWATMCPHAQDGTSYCGTLPRFTAVTGVQCNFE